MAAKKTVATETKKATVTPETKAPVASTTTETKKATTSKEKVAAKATEEKTTAKKETKTTAKTTAKTASKTTSAKKAVKSVDTKVSYFLQFSGKEVNTSDVLETVKKIWVEKFQGKLEDIKTIELYFKPEENKAYFVVNGLSNGEYFVEL